MARARIPRTRSRKRSRKLPAVTAGSDSTDALLSLTFDEFRETALRWYLERRLIECGGRVSRLAVGIGRHRTETYRLLQKLHVDVAAIQARCGVRRYGQKAYVTSETQVALQRWLTSNATARPEYSAIIAPHGRRS